jgi:hypothetical protein
MKLWGSMLPHNRNFDDIRMHGATIKNDYVLFDDRVLMKLVNHLEDGFLY